MIIVGPTETPATYIAIDSINLIPAGAVNVQLKDGAANYGGLYSFAQNQGFVLENAMHHMQGVISLGPNNSFIINLSSPTQVSGFVRYRLLATA